MACLVQALRGNPTASREAGEHVTNTPHAARVASCSSRVLFRTHILRGLWVCVCSDSDVVPEPFQQDGQGLDCSDGQNHQEVAERSEGARRIFARPHALIFAGLELAGCPSERESHGALHTCMHRDVRVCVVVAAHGADLSGDSKGHASPQLHAAEASQIPGEDRRRKSGLSTRWQRRQVDGP